VASPAKIGCARSSGARNPKQAAIALANRMARTACALMKNQTEFQAAQAA